MKRLVITPRLRKCIIPQLLLLLLLYGICNTSGIFKYCAVLLLACISFCLYHNIYVRDFIVFIPAAVFLIYGLLVFLINTNSSIYEVIRMILFLIVPLLGALALKQIAVKNHHNNQIRTYCYTIFFAIVAVFAWVNITATQKIEHQYVFIIGAYSLYFVNDDKLSLKKKIGMVVLCLLLEAYVGGKRLSFVAQVVTLLVYWLGSTIVKKCKNSTCNKFFFIGWTLVYLVLLWYLQFCKLGGAYYLRDVLEIKVSGRENAWSYFVTYYDVDLLYPGQGLGWVLTRLGELRLRAFSNLHNDIMMIYLDAGFLGFTLWFFSNYLICLQTNNIKNRLTILCLLVYTLINYMTDNIFIYISYQLPFNIILYSLIYDKQTERQKTD